jgi:hypothetical protein
MKAFPIAAGLLFALGACSGSAEEQIENSIRGSLANQTNVDQVEMNTTADGNMTGYALTHEADGRKGRLKCEAHPEGSEFKYKCTPEIDAETERQMQDVIRTALAKQGEVVDLVMKRKDDDNHMAGSATVRAADGAEYHLSCTAVRKEAANFTWGCEDASAKDGIE